MNSVLEYKDLIGTLYKMFPDYSLWLGENKNHLNENVSVNFSFLIFYAHENWDNHELQLKMADLMERMVASRDDEVSLITGDFFLDFYLHFKENKTSLEPFLDKLNIPTNNRIVGSYDYWVKANF